MESKRIEKTLKTLVKRGQYVSPDCVNIAVRSLPKNTPDVLTVNVVILMSNAYRQGKIDLSNYILDPDVSILDVEELARSYIDGGD